MKKIILALVMGVSMITMAGPMGCPGRCPGGFVGPGGIRPGCGPCRPCGPCGPCRPWGPPPPHHGWGGRAGAFWGGVACGALLSNGIGCRTYYASPAVVPMGRTIVCTQGGNPYGVVTTPVAVSAPVVPAPYVVPAQPVVQQTVVEQPVYQQTVIQQRQPLISAGVNVLGVGVGVSAL